MALFDDRLRSIFLTADKPGRYTGGEFGAAVPKPGATLRAALSYPDLYELGMSNLAIQILYRRLNALPDVFCERVFPPAPDFGQALATAGLPLFTLESGTDIKNLDIIGFSLGYELIVTNVLYMLSLSRIPLRASDRGEGHPILLAGGPAVVNPLPFSDFFEGIFIGEGEEEVPRLFMELAGMKKAGQGRAALVSHIRSGRHVYHREKTGRTFRSVWRGFGLEDDAGLPVFPVPNIKTVQDHGIVEIMRGCPNGCRFCQAGFTYRPCREKKPEAVFKEVEALVKRAGYTEITLSSLSTGDYTGIYDLLRELNGIYESRRVSFSLPSLKVSSFLLPLLQEVKTVRKTGLTFAIETPDALRQLCLNKNADREKIAGILTLAKKLGWRGAKFYFMIGLPSIAETEEEKEIVAFMREMHDSAPMNYSVNIGTFVPKPHTPYQWADMLPMEESRRRITYIKKNLPKARFKVSYHDPFQSFLEAVISRGDERTCAVIEQAFLHGARMDAWEEHLNEEAWRSAFADAGYDIEKETLRRRTFSENLPWAVVDTGVSASYLKKELEKSEQAVVTGTCSPSCGHNCGACGKDGGVRAADPVKKTDGTTPAKPAAENGAPVKLLISFEKKGKAVFLSHLNLIRIFERSLIRAGYPPCYTEGFNPQPRLEFAQPLSLGFESEGEICSLVLPVLPENPSEKDLEMFLTACGEYFPEGIRILRAGHVEKTGSQVREPSLMSLYAGSEYELTLHGTRYFPSIGAVEDSLRTYMEGEGLSGLDVIGREGRSLQARLEFRSDFTTGMLKLLTKALGCQDILAKGLKVTRKKMLARAIQPAANNPPRVSDYFSVLTKGSSLALASFQK